MTPADKLQTELRSKQKLQKKLLLKTGVLINNLIYSFIAFTIKLALYINGGLEIKGKENINTEEGIIIASNHLSYLDPPLLGAITPRKANFMARKGLFKIPVIGGFINHFAIPVDREKTFPSTIKEAVKRLKNGGILIIFPEGRRSETGKLLEGKRGVGTIAHLSKAPVVPALITGTNKALPFGARWLKRAKVSIVFDKPIYPSAAQKGNHVSENITQQIMSALGALKKQYADNSG